MKKAPPSLLALNVSIPKRRRDLPRTYRWCTWSTNEPAGDPSFFPPVPMNSDDEPEQLAQKGSNSAPCRRIYTRVPDGSLPKRVPKFISFPPTRSRSRNTERARVDFTRWHPLIIKLRGSHSKMTTAVHPQTKIVHDRRGREKASVSPSPHARIRFQDSGG